MKFLELLRNLRYMQYFSAIAATLSIASSAVYGTWASPSLPKLTSENSPIGTIITPEEGSWIASSFVLGSIPGALITGPLVDKFGRRGSLLLCAVPLFVPWIIISFAESVIALIIARIIAGMGSAVAITVAPIYTSEIAENDIRGKLGLLCNLLMNTGSLFVLSVGPFISYRALAISCSAFPLVFLILFYCMPESPYYLLKTNKKDAARNSLITLCSNGTEEKIIEIKLNEISNTVVCDMRNKSTLWEFLFKREYRKSLILMIGIKTLQQLSGMSAIDSYMQSIIGSSNSGLSPELTSIICGFIQIPAVLVAVALVDKIGRKPLMMISSLGCAIALIGEGVYFYLQDVEKLDMDYLSWLPASGLMFYLVMNPIGVFSLPYVILGELFPINIKDVSASVTTVYGSVLAFLVIKFFKPISDAWGIHTTFWIFAAVCILGFLFVLFALPETKGKSFAEIQEKLNESRTAQYGTIQYSRMAVNIT